MIRLLKRGRKLALIRKASTQAIERYGIGGRAKSKPRPAITLPKLKCLESKP